MGIPIAELQDAITPEEFNLYRASFELIPAVADLLDYQTAFLSAVIFNSQGGKSKPIDFYPDRFTDPEEREAQQMDAFVRRAVAMSEYDRINKEIEAEKIKEAK